MGSRNAYDIKIADPLEVFLALVIFKAWGIVDADLCTYTDYSHAVTVSSDDDTSLAYDFTVTVCQNTHPTVTSEESYGYRDGAATKPVAERKTRKLGVKADSEWFEKLDQCLRNMLISSTPLPQKTLEDAEVFENILGDNINLQTRLLLNTAQNRARCKDLPGTPCS